MFYVYVIESDKSLYVGRTTDLPKRLKEHNQNHTKSTKSMGPWKYIYFEACLNIDDAKRRENYLKTSQGMRLLKRRLKEYLYLSK